MYILSYYITNLNEGDFKMYDSHKKKKVIKEYKNRKSVINISKEYNSLY